MNLLEIIILGIVEGLTEYLPVSSTGHLLLTESLLNMSQSKEALDALAVCIQGGGHPGGAEPVFSAGGRPWRRACAAIIPPG